MQYVYYYLVGWDSYFVEAHFYKEKDDWQDGSQIKKEHSVTIIFGFLVIENIDLFLSILSQRIGNLIRGCEQFAKWKIISKQRHD